jgi:hypothetical protein
MTDDTNDDLYDLLTSLVAQAAKQQARIEELESRYSSLLEARTRSPERNQR